MSEVNDCPLGYGHGGHWCGPHTKCWLDPRPKHERGATPALTQPQPIAAQSAPDEREAWTASKPTEPGAYWVRGNGLEADALVQVKLDDGELWCNLHMSTTESDFGYGYSIEQLSDDFEWLGPLHVGAAWQRAQSAPVVPEGYRWYLVPKEDTDAFNAACSAANDAYLGGVGPCGVFIAGYRAMLAAAPQPAAPQEQGDEVRRLREALEKLEHRYAEHAKLPCPDWVAASSVARAIRMELSAIDAALSAQQMEGK